MPFEVVFRESNKSSVKVDEAFDADFEYEYFGGHANKELAFLYKPDRTLIQADLMFNLPATEQYSKTGELATSGVLTKLFTIFQNTQGSAVWQKRFIWYTSAKDKPSFNASAQRVGSWDFDRIIPCHGDVIERDGKGIFQKVYQWHLQGHK